MYSVFLAAWMAVLRPAFPTFEYSPKCEYRVKCDPGPTWKAKCVYESDCRIHSDFAPLNSFLEGGR